MNRQYRSRVEARHHTLLSPTISQHPSESSARHSMLSGTPTSERNFIYAQPSSDVLKLIWQDDTNVVLARRRPAASKSSLPNHASGSLRHQPMFQ